MPGNASYLLYPSLQAPVFPFAFPGPGPEAIEWFMPLSEPSAFLRPRSLPVYQQQFFAHQLLAVFTGYGLVTLHAKHDEVIELHAKHKEIITLHGKLEKGSGN